MEGYTNILCCNGDKEQKRDIDNQKSIRILLYFFFEDS
jgi:hypothetical protein